MDEQRETSMDETCAAGVETDIPVRPYLTLVIVRDAEKDPRLIEYCLSALAMQELDEVQVIVLDQALGQTPLPIVYGVSAEVFHSQGASVGPVRMWDVCSDMREIAPHITGKYLMMMHQEFIAAPGWVAESIAWLKTNGEPDIALSNLMRLGTTREIDKRVTSSSKGESVKIKRVISSGDAGRLAVALDKAASVPWIYRRETPDGMWAEDAYFARTDWLETLQFWHHADRMLFQDVYDIMGEACKLIGQRVPRVPVGKIYHLWHPKSYPQYSEDVRAYFAQNPRLWEGTYFADADYSRKIEEYLKDPLSFPVNPIVAFRRGSLGTVARWLRAFESHWRATNPGALQDPEGLDIPVAERTGYALLVTPRQYRADKPKWKQAIALAGGTRKPVRTHAPGQPIPAVCNCVITAENLDVFLHEMGNPCKQY